jgi:hypothetical protein
MDGASQARYEHADVVASQTLFAELLPSTRSELLPSSSSSSIIDLKPQKLFYSSILSDTIIPSSAKVRIETDSAAGLLFLSGV